MQTVQQKIKFGNDTKNSKHLQIWLYHRFAEYNQNGPGEYEITIHPPHVTVIEARSLMRLSPKKVIEVTYYVVTNNLLPSPYPTNCKNYIDIGYQSQQDCINQCLARLTLKYCPGKFPGELAAPASSNYS